MSVLGINPLETQKKKKPLLLKGMTMGETSEQEKIVSYLLTKELGAPFATGLPRSPLTRGTPADGPNFFFIGL